MEAHFQNAVCVRLAILFDGSVDDIVAETFEIARMMGASMRKRGYSGWASA